MIGLVRADLFKFFKFSLSRYIFVFFLLFVWWQVFSPNSSGEQLLNSLQLDKVMFLVLVFGGFPSTLAFGVLPLAGYVLAQEIDSWKTVKYYLAYYPRRGRFLVARVVSLVLVFLLGLLLAIALSFALATFVLAINGKPIYELRLGDHIPLLLRIGSRVALVILATTLLGMWLAVINPTLGRFAPAIILLESTFVSLLPPDVGRYFFTKQIEDLMSANLANLRSTTGSSVIPTGDHLTPMLMLGLYSSFFLISMILLFGKKDLR